MADPTDTTPATPATPVAPVTPALDPNDLPAAAPAPGTALIQRLIDEFSIPAATFDGMTVLYAALGGFGNEAMCEVIYEQDGRQFEVKAAHTSGQGFEGLWQPVRTEGHILKNFYADPVARRWYEQVFGSDEMRNLDTVIASLIVPLTSPNATT